MSYISFNKFGRSKVFYNVSGKNKLQDESFGEVNRSVRDLLTALKLNLTTHAANKSYTK